MQRLGLAAVAVLVLASGHWDQVGAGWKKHRGCSGCSAPVMVGCQGCASPYSYGCSTPGCYAPTCSGPSCFAPNCGGGCSSPFYGCAASSGRPEYAPYVYMPNPTIQYGYAGGGCAESCGRPEYAPYVYQPNPYVNTYGVGSPYGFRTVNTQTVLPSSDAYPVSYPQMSSYNAPVAPSIPAIPPLPPAEDVAW